jgi:hypothetical protein
VFFVSPFQILGCDLMYLQQTPTLHRLLRVPPLGPALIPEAVALLGALSHLEQRAAFVQACSERLPARFSASSRPRFARYLARPYVVGESVDQLALRVLAAPLREATKRQFALLRLAEVEPGLGLFLDECLPDPDWRWFSAARLRRWMSERRGTDDPTSASRLLAALKQGGYLRPLDRVWVVAVPPPAPTVLLFGFLREVGAPSQTTLEQLLATRVVGRTLAPVGAVRRLLEWAAAFDAVRWSSFGDALWFPWTAERALQLLIDHGLPEPTLL